MYSQAAMSGFIYFHGLLRWKVNAGAFKDLSFHLVLVHLYSFLVSIDVFLLFGEPSYHVLAVPFPVWIAT
nr:hypothetical protein CFP56_62656 [Quercus suber]